MQEEVKLKSSHLIIPPDIANAIFQDSANVYVSFKEESMSFLISPKKNSWFPKLHKSMEFMLKSKDAKGSKSIAIRELLIDHEITDEDQLLTCEVNEKKGFIKVNMTNNRSV